MYLGMILFEQKEYEKALPHFEFVSKTMPWLKKIWYYKGATLSLLRRFMESKDSYLEYVKRAPKEGASWSYLAVAYYLLGKPEVSLEWLRKSEEFVTEQKELVLYARALILEKTNIDDALICLLDLQLGTSDESMKKTASEHIHKLIIKNIDPLKRTGMA